MKKKLPCLTALSPNSDEDMQSIASLKIIQIDS